MVMSHDIVEVRIPRQQVLKKPGFQGIDRGQPCDTSCFNVGLPHHGTHHGRNIWVCDQQQEIEELGCQS